MLSNLLKPKQQEAFETITRDGKGGIVFSAVGTGKTRIGLLGANDIINKASGQAYRGAVILVICRRKAFYDWSVEVEKLGFGQSWDVVELEDVKPNWAFVNRTIILCSHGSLISIVAFATLQSVTVDTIIIDEGYLFSNPQSKRSKALKKLHYGVPRIVLSGSLMPARDLIQIYGQVAQAGRGLSLAPHATAFRSRFQVGIQEAHYSYYPKPGSYKRVMEAIAPFTFVYFPPASEREIKDSIIRCSLTKQQQMLMAELRSTYAIEGHFELKSAATLIQKAQQISNGWFENERKEIVTFPSGKVDRCVSLVEEILANPEEKVVIWCAFRHDLVRLKESLEASSCVRSGIATLQGGEDFNIKFWQRLTTRICLATEASGSSVNHFGQVAHAIYFSQDFKWLNLQQSKGRTNRTDSKHKTCYYMFLHSDGSLDSRVHYTVRHSQQSEASLIKQMDVMQWLKG